MAGTRDIAAASNAYLPLRGAGRWAWNTAGSTAAQSSDESGKVPQLAGSGDAPHLAKLHAQLTGTRREPRQGRLAVMQEHQTPPLAVQPAEQLEHYPLGSAEGVAVRVVNDGSSPGNAEVEIKALQVLHPRGQPLACLLDRLGVTPCEVHALVRVR